MVTGLGAAAIAKSPKSRPEPQEAWKVLLGILRARRFPKMLPVRHVAGDDGCGEPRLDRTETGGLRAAAGIARDADALRIHVGARQEIIDRTDAVPCLVTGKCSSREETLCAGHVVLARPHSNARFAGFRVEVLNALTLAGRIECEDERSLLRERDPGLLVVPDRLAGVAVPGCPDHRRKPRRPSGRDIHVRRDINFGMLSKRRFSTR
jgi:hypothetical protein